MLAITSRTAFGRSAVALAMALLLALRLLSPAGFMPEFVDGAVTIVACPDAGPVMAGHDHQQSKAKLHQTCPYAAAGALGGLANEPAPLVALLVVGLALLLGRTHSFIVAQRAHERPPLRGPPIPA